ncbi:hypothetical protein C6499_12505 [Candidatus Poribacteria bacterium]|nr:MAG: hypothetical protein C6499_12505 [Candidatus Poribacteria bacterium]
MSNDLMKQIQNRVNSDVGRQFRSFGSFTKKPQKTWSVSALKAFALFSIGLLASTWAFILNWAEFESWIGFTVVSGVSAIIVVPMLFVENVRVTDKPHNGQFQISRYINTFLFIGLAVISALIGWFIGTLVSKFIGVPYYPIQ